jgi:MFS family permease
LQRSYALRSNRNYLYLLSGRAFSEFGDYFGELAISWLIYSGTGSVLVLGTTWLFFLIPRSVVRLWGGVYVDRFEKRSVMIFTETARGILFGLLAAAVAVGLSPAPVVYAVSLLVGVLGAIFDIASQAVLPQLVEPESLLSANSYLTAAFQADSIIGPAAAGIAIYAVGTAASLSIDSFSFFVLLVALVLIRLPSSPNVPDPGRSWRSEFSQGWDYFRSRAELIWLGLLVGGANFALGGFWYVYALIFAKDVLNSGSAGFGALNSFSAVGIFATSTYLGRKGVARPRLSVIISMFAMGGFIILTSLARALPEALLAIAAFGAAIPLVSIVQNTYYQRTVPENLMGRVFGFQQFLDYVTIPAGIVFAIYAEASYGVTAGIFISGLVILSFGFASLLSRSLRKLDAGVNEVTSQSR